MIMPIARTPKLQLTKTMKLKTACLVCGIPFGTKFGLCSHCSPKLFHLQEPTARDECGLPVYSLFAWRRDGWPALRSVAMNLKGRDQAEPWLELAAWMIQALGDLPAAPRVMVPVPSSGANHALGWARALGYWTDSPVLDLLLRHEGRPNKELSKHERGRLRFAVRPSSAVESSNYKSVIIVDDIITTGATARAAHSALGRPRNCEVWCLMDRRPWQGEGPLL